MRGNVLKAVAKNYGRGRGVAVAAGMLACAGMVWSSSHAAFTGSTSNEGNKLAAGTVTITDNDGTSAAMFAAPALAPGGTGSACIGVQYTGSVAPDTIKMYFPTAMAKESQAGGAYGTWDADADAKMDDVTTLKVEINDTDLAAVLPTTFPNCPAVNWDSTPLVAATPIKSLITGKSTFADTDITVPVIAKDKWRVLKFSYELPASADNDVQGDGIQFGVTWEAKK